MKEFVLTILIFAFTDISVALPRETYANIRNEILQYERQLMFGANLTLNDIEETANKVLMKAKKNELHNAFRDPRRYAPGKNFLEVKKDIERSEVFKIIRRMPKGAVLHAHDTALTSMEYVYSNITFRDDLYVCEVNGTLHLRFFKVPDKTCNWELLQTVRKNPVRAGRVNEKILKQMSMICDNPSTAYPNVDKAWEKFVDIFMFITPLLTYKPVYEDHFYRGLEELDEDNVMYLELRSTLPKLYDLHGTVYAERDVVSLYQRMTERYVKKHPHFLGAKVIYAPQRSVDHATARGYVKTLLELHREFPKTLAGFDLVGQEDRGNTLEYFAEIIRDIDKNISFFFHAGETNWYGATTDENLVDALLLNTRRIGHGYALAYHPFLLEVMKRMDIAVEVNPISNQVLSLVGDLRNHAARRLFAESYPVVISNDDPGLWGARALSYDFYEAFMALMSEYSDLRALKLLALNSLSYSSLSDSEKKDALARWEKKWDIFVKNLSNGKY